MTLNFADPPDPGNGPGRPKGSGKWQPVADELRANPGRWALVAQGQKTRSLALQTTRNVGSFTPRGHFQAATRRTPDGYDIYMRYVGEPS